MMNGRTRIHCPDCAAAAPAVARFCPQCGNALAGQAGSPAQPPPVPHGHPVEHVVYSDYDLTVTTARIVVGPQTYPVSAVTSATTYARRTPKPFAVFLVAVGALALFAGNVGHAGGWVCVGSLLVVVNLIRLAFGRTEHVVRLGGPAGRIDVFRTKDRRRAEALTRAVGSAISWRGG